MRDINELIGLIKGVSFDGVINTQEIIRLRSWIEKNKTLVCDEKQEKLIRIVEKIIKKNNIDDIARVELENICNEYLNENEDSFTKINEFYGILDGIISDNIINDSEIEHLKEWFNSFGGSVSNYKPYEDLCKILDSVIKKGTILPEEHTEIVSIIREKIELARFETKIHTLRLLIKARINIGIHLIDLLDDNKTINRIHRLAENEINNALRTYSGTVEDESIVFISLVLIAMLQYDGNFYDNVFNTYPDLYNRFSSQKIEGFIRSILSKYKNSINCSSKTRIINVILSNAIVPFYFIKSFFDFVFDIYKLNFQYNLSDNLYEDFEFVFDGLRNAMNSDNDDLNLNVTKKTYKLIKTTKELISNQSKTSAVIRLSIIVVKIIDNYYWNKESNILNPYLKHGFDNWVSSQENEIKNLNKSKSIKKTKSRWETKYYIEDKDIYIIPPIHWVKSNYDYKQIKIVITNDKEVIFIDECPKIKEIIGGYQIDINYIKICKPLGKINYRLMVGDEIIYDSKEKLYRDFIVFNESGKEINNNTNYIGTAIICYNSENNNIKPFFINDNYKLAVKDTKLGDVININGKVFNFSSLEKPYIYGDKLDNYYIRKISSDTLIPVFKKVNLLVFECNIINSNIEIIVNDKKYSINNFKYDMFQQEGVNKYSVNLEIDKPDIYNLSVYNIVESKRIKIISFDFSIDNNIKTEMIYIDSDIYLFSLKSSLIGKEILEDIKLKSFNTDFIIFEKHLHQYIYYIPIKLNIYRITNCSWTSFAEPLWFEDIKQDTIMEVYDSEIDEVDVCTENNNILVDSIKLKGNNISKYFPISFLKNYQKSNSYVKLVFKNNTVAKKVLYCYFKCVLDHYSTKLYFDPINKTLNILPIFWGKGKVECIIKDDKNNEVYKNEFLENNKSIVINGLSSFRDYRIIFCEKINGLFKTNYNILCEYKQTFFAWDDFVGKTFKILNVEYENVVNNKLKRFNQEMKNVYILFKKKICYDKFIGKIFIKVKNTTVWQKINPVNIEICSEIIDGIMEVAINKDGDGLLLDKKNSRILNTIEDYSSPDIYSYNIVVKRGINLL